MALADVVEFVSVHFAAECVAVDAEDLRCARLIAVGVLENAFDEFFLELGDGFLEKDAALDHQSDQRFQLIFHDSTLRDTAVWVATIAARPFSRVRDR